jgi:anti-sigma factor RsiW
MNCRNWEERIALYAGGDLREPETAEVDRHLADCEGCRDFAAGLKESLQLMRNVHEEPVAEAHFAAVRARVMGELEGRRLPWWRSAWVYGFSAAALALLLIVTLVPRRPVERPIRAATVSGRWPATERELPAIRPDVAPSPAPLHRVHPAHAVRHRRPLPILPVSAPPDLGPPAVVKMLTDDPDVVIYWITDNSGE